MEFLLSMLACPVVLSLLRQPGLCNLVDAASIIFPGDSISQQTSCSFSTCNISAPSFAMLPEPSLQKLFYRYFIWSWAPHSHVLSAI